MKFFYSHLIEIESVVISLDEMDLTDSQRKHLASLVDSTIHQTVLDIILSRLSKTDKEVFLHRLRKDPKDQELMNFVKDKVEDIEKEITAAVKKLREDLHEDIKEARRRQGSGG